MALTTSSVVELVASPASASGASSSVAPASSVSLSLGRGRLAVLDLAQTLLDLFVDAAHSRRCEPRRGDRRRRRAETIHHVFDEIDVTDRADRRGALAPLVLEEPLERRCPGEPDPTITVCLLQRPSAFLGNGLKRLGQIVLWRQVCPLGALLLRLIARAEVLERLLRPLRDRLRHERPGLQVLLERFGDDLLVAKDRVHSRAQRLSSGHAVGRSQGPRGRPSRPGAAPRAAAAAVDAVPVVIRHGGPSRLERQGCEARRRWVRTVVRLPNADGTA